MKRANKQPRDPGRVTGADSRALFFAAYEAMCSAEYNRRPREKSEVDAMFLDRLRRAEKFAKDAEKYRARAREIRDYLRTAKQEGGAS